MIFSEIGNCMIVRYKSVDEPSHFHISSAFPSKHPGRTDPIIIPIQIKFKQIFRWIRRSSSKILRRFGFCKSKLIDLQCIYQSINYLHRIFSRNPCIHAIHDDLISVDSFNKVQFVLFIFNESKNNEYSDEEKKY